MTTDAITSKTRSSIMETIQIELEIVGMRTEQEEALAGMPRRKDECKVHPDL